MEDPFEMTHEVPPAKAPIKDSFLNDFQQEIAQVRLERMSLSQEAFPLRQQEANYDSPSLQKRISADQDNFDEQSQLLVLKLQKSFSQSPRHVPDTEITEQLGIKPNETVE